MTNLNLHTHHEHMGASSKDSPTDDLRPAPSSDTLPGMSPYTIDLSCLICGKTFNDRTLLKNHCEDHTNFTQTSPTSTEEQMEHCNNCGEIFKNARELDLHVQEQHSEAVTCPSERFALSTADCQTQPSLGWGKSPPVDCDLCDESIMSPNTVADPMERDHAHNLGDHYTPGQFQSNPVHENIPQYDCIDTLDSSDNDRMDIHDTRNSSSSNFIHVPDTTCIPQFDGVDDGLDGDSGRVGGTELDAVTENLTPSVLHVSYQLNKQRQVSKLVRDTNIADYDIVANDDDRNVCIQCSVGFYEAVAKPALSSLSTGFSVIISGISIRCLLVRKTQDKNSSMQGLLLRFEISGPDIHPGAASLAVHLHFTSRKIQLQGGASMPDGSKAPVWFTEFILKPMFISQAKAKNYDISKINNLVKGLGTNELKSKQSQQNCYHCKKAFSGKARPVPCTRCSQNKHSTKCMPCPNAPKPILSSKQATSTKTMSAPTTSSLIVSELPTSTSSSSTSIPTVPKPPTSLPRSSLTPQTQPVNEREIQPRSDPVPVQASASAPTANMSLQSTQLPTAASQLDASSSILVPGLPSSSASSVTPFQESFRPSTQQSTTAGKKKDKQKAPTLALTPEAAEIAFLKQELDYATTKITMLDTEIEDLNKTIKIQDSRLKIFEDEQNKRLNAQYLDPNKTAHGETQFCTTSARTCCTHSPSCPRCSTPPCCHHTGAHHKDTYKHIQGLFKEVETIKNFLKDLTQSRNAKQKSRIPQETENPDNSDKIIEDVDVDNETNDISINSIEEFMPPITTETLNFQPLTNQLP